MQGVGFRPFVYRLATELELRGYVLNSSSGVIIELEGARVREFIARFAEEKPARAILQSVETSWLDPVGYENFTIRESDHAGAKTALILPDLATCDDCVRDIFDPASRRFRYPFTNCTNCGPRFSIIEALPYDRVNTSMKQFTMCPECEREYHDPRDRRFHAQPNACPNCGPQLALWNPLGQTVGRGDEALRETSKAIQAGKIVALKGLGGFQLLVDARNNEAVVSLRERKHREEKPFALMFSSIHSIRDCCEVSPAEERLLVSSAAPIVLLKHIADLAGSVAPRNPNLGAMLPCTPLHHLLMRELNFPVVATSGNLSDEPICIEEQEALVRLQDIADLFLVHDRPIVRHVDDSIVRLMCGRELVLRRARGFAPLPITLKNETQPTLALGAHLKNTVALGVGNNAFVSQHIGDLATAEAFDAFRAATADLPRLYDVMPEIVACDLHPDYLSTKHALQLDLPVAQVQHHFAHIVACMAENEIEPPALGVSWDGTGFGTDGTIWGGEFLLAGDTGFERLAHLRRFRLPGGEAAVKEPRRTALGLLYEIFGDDLWNRGELLRDFSAREVPVLRQMLKTGTNAPLTSSAGRLFDGIAALIGLRKFATFEGQAAMELEFAICAETTRNYPFNLQKGSPAIIDWAPAVSAILDDMRQKKSTGEIAAKFHNMMIEAIIAVARKLGEPKVVLSGGCFQNRYLTERTVSRLREEDFQPYWHQRIPPNDGGISLGQLIAARWANSAR